MLLVVLNFLPVRFDSARWKASPSGTARGNEQPPRQQMVDDLLKSGVLSGKTRPEVDLLLGLADTTEYFRKYDMVYVLGMERNSYFGIDSEWLVIKFDDAGRVAVAKLVTD